MIDQVGGSSAQALPLPGKLSAFFEGTSLPKFIAVTLQLGLLILILEHFSIEERSGLLNITKLVFFGFIVHAWLPMPWRMPFFFGLTVAAMVLVLGAINAAWLVGISLVMIGLCHLPIPRLARGVLVAIAGAGLMAMRMAWFTTEWSGVIIGILGSMFMFRIVLYLYDMPGEKKKANLWERLCYFFMLPNVIFPFYPIVDYITYRRTYYNKDAYTIYQKGVLWMLRGAIHLLVYRVVYYHMSPSVDDITGLGGVLLFIISSYLLYLRISGLFHLIVGMLCLFGFNLPETHKLYFLASGFNDYWRRINIYWKDFMMKIFFYPIYMKTRNWGATTALVFSTLLVFIFTWLLHSYQWFWLQGRFPILEVDAVYWGVLGILVAINSVWETKKGNKKKLSTNKSGWDYKAAAGLSLRTTATFLFLSLMWSYWSSESSSEWWAIMSQVTNSGAQEFMWLGLGILGLFVGIFAWFGLEDNGWGITFDEHKATFVKTALFTSIGLLAVYSLGQPQVNEKFGVKSASFIASLQADRMSIKDEQVQERGYYEQLLDSRPQMSALWSSNNQRPADWKGMVPAGVARSTDDLWYEELFPEIKTVFKRAPLTTNQWRMRDQDYTLEKPANTVRMAMFGKSYEMGWGVRNDQVFEQVTEDRLNAELSPQTGQNYEMLNFSVGGYTVIQYVLLAEGKLKDFSPDVLFVTAHAGEGSRVVANVLKSYAKDVEFPPELQQIIDKAGIDKDMPYSDQKRRLDEYEEEFVRWGYERVLKVCEEEGILPIWIYIPRTMDHLDNGEGSNMNEDEYKRWAEVATEMGFKEQWSLIGAFNEYEEVSEIQLAEWDTHPNILGHELLGDMMYEALVARQDVLETAEQ
ncbi:MAG: hypothetical protein AB8G77_21820 [Rhodothermales bacterium]